MSSSDLSECQSKFDKVLAAFLNQNFQINNDVYLEMIISHLTGRYCKEHTEFVSSKTVSDFFDSSIVQWESESPPSADIAAFTLQLLSLNALNVENFMKLQEKLLTDRFQNCVLNHKKLQSPSVYLGHVLLLKAVANHKAGLDWIKSNSSWKICLDYYNKHQTIYITRETSSFMYDILDKYSSDGDDETTMEIIKTLLKPLIDNVWMTSESNVLVNDEKTQKIMSPLLSLMNQIFRKMLESTKRTKLAYHILITHRFETNVWKLTDTIHDREFMRKIWQVQILANFTRLSNMLIPADDTKTTDLSFDKFTVNFLNYINFTIRRGDAQNAIMMAEMNHVLWKMMGDRAPEEVILKNQKIKFGDQILLIQLFPIVYVLKCRKAMDEPEYLEKFCIKLFDISCEFTTRLIYAYRDMLIVSNINVTDLACKSIQGIASMKNSLPRNRAIIVFQAFVYILKEYLPGICLLEKSADLSNTDLILETPNLLSAILNGLYELIQNYRFTWKECIESTILVNFMLNLLNNPNLPARIAVLALKLTQISIEHFLAPNLALLMDNLKGSGLEFLGPMIYKRLHDNNWEVRDSTLELLTSVIQISEMKFPAFQKHILDNNICPIVESIAKNDSEPYVKASAFKCLTVMVKIKSFWETSLSNMNLMQYLITVFDNESEGVVRREALNTITEIYAHHKIQSSCLDSIFSVLAYSAVNDLYWEVKLNALNFWRMVMCRQFQHQGMIDGTFPSVTFSKEHKKIITLTNKEIILRLSLVLNELSLRGCLGVLLECLNDECDLQVVKLTDEIVQRLMFYLIKYNYLEERKNLKAGSSTKVPIIDTNYSEVKSSAELNATRNNADYDSANITQFFPQCNSDEVIESIVNLDDLSLLSISYKNSLVVNTSGDNFQADCKCVSSRIGEDLYKEYAKVTPDQFLDTIVKKDIKESIKQREMWIEQTESFSSLLDDVLFSYYATEVNDADCY